MARASFHWTFALDPTAPRALAAFLKRTIAEWLPVASSRRELALPTALVVLPTPTGHARVLPCAPLEASSLVPELDVFASAPEGAVWCAVALPRARGRWWIRHEVVPSRGLRLVLARGPRADTPPTLSKADFAFARRRAAARRKRRAPSS